MTPDYTDDEIIQAANRAHESPRNGSYSFLRNFLAALPERPQARPGPWPGQQEAIDAAFAACSITPLTTVGATLFFERQSAARLAIAQAYDAARPQAAEIARLKAELENVTRRLQAAKGQGEAMSKNIPGDKCPLCGADEIASDTPRTTYACGSSDYDGRPDTFHPGDKCEPQPQAVAVNEQAQLEPAAQPWTPENAKAFEEFQGELRETWDKDKAWTPAVGDTVRLKSGGPAMTVTGVDPLSLMCAWMNADDELQVEPITTLCLEPAKP